jgi:hypothetical protein
MKLVIEDYKNNPEHVYSRLRNQKSYIDQVYNWNFRKLQWEGLLNQMVSLPREFEKDQVVFNYMT